MWWSLEILSGRYDWPFLVEAVLLGLLTALTSFRVFIRALRSNGLLRLGWLAASSLIAGLGIWAANFSVIIAYDPGLAVRYDPLWATLSLVAGTIVAAGLGPAVMRASPRQAALVAGCYTGVVLAFLQVVSLTAWEMPARIAWHWPHLLAAAAVGSVLAVAAILVARQSRRWWQRMAAAGLLTTAVFAEHLMARLGLELVPDPTRIAGSGLTQGQMAFAVALVTLLLTGIAFLLAALERRAQSLALHRMRNLADAAVEGIVLCDDGIITDANASFCALVGIPRDRLRGRPFVELVAAEDRAQVPAATDDKRELEIVDSDGAPIPVEIAWRDLVMAPTQQRAVTVRDLRERRSAEQRIQHLAHHDPLTGVLNRVRFNEQLHRAIELAVATGNKLAVLALDLDRFKEVNDVFGHAAGDVVLMEVARRLREEVGPHDLIARLGGDEFVIVQRGGAQPDAAGELAERLIEATKRPFAVEDQAASVGLSVGICLFPHHSSTAEALLANADTALYRAKGGGGSRARYFDAEMDTAMRARRTLAHDLRQGLSNGDLRIHYQPQVRTETGEIIAFEALVRWTHPYVGQIPPSEFIEIAEEYGIILDLGEWVLQQACAEATRWSKPLTVAVNVSPVQIQQGDLPTCIAQTLFRTGLPPSRLEIEITETVLVKDFHHALNVLRRIKALGVRVAMDDFGTGYSSLANLQAFPFDKLKIDRTFIDRIGSQPQAEGIVRAVLGLGRSLRIPVVAEGVETADQAEFLRREQCQELQGYLFGRPNPIDHFADTIGARAPTLAPDLPQDEPANAPSLNAASGS
jgi:diguanylate cyclase (GGDEF)-like protein/PAS domain S-box-containing protein